MIPTDGLEGRSVPVQGFNLAVGPIVIIGADVGKLLWNANGLQTLFATSPAATALVPATIVDGTREIGTAITISQYVLHLVFNGTSGTTTWEVWLRRAGANTLMASLSIVSSSTNYAQVTAVPITPLLAIGDRLYVQPVAVATNAFSATIEAQL